MARRRRFFGGVRPRCPPPPPPPPRALLTPARPACRATLVSPRRSLASWRRGAGYPRLVVKRSGDGIIGAQHQGRTGARRRRSASGSSCLCTAHSAARDPSSPPPPQPPPRSVLVRSPRHLRRPQRPAPLPLLLLLRRNGAEPIEKLLRSGQVLLAQADDVIHEHEACARGRGCHDHGRRRRRGRRQGCCCCWRRPTHRRQSRLYRHCCRRDCPAARRTGRGSRARAAGRLEHEREQ